MREDPTENYQAKIREALKKATINESFYSIHGSAAQNTQTGWTNEADNQPQIRSELQIFKTYKTILICRTNKQNKNNEGLQVNNILYTRLIPIYPNYRNN